MLSISFWHLSLKSGSIFPNNSSCLLHSNFLGSSFSFLFFNSYFDANENVIPSNNGYNLEKDENGKITGITFTALDDGKNTNTYTITYRTKADRKWDKETVTNKATFKPSTGDGMPSTGTVDVPGAVSYTHLTLPTNSLV